MPAAIANARLIKLIAGTPVSDVALGAPVTIGVLQPAFEPVLLLRIITHSQEKGEPLGGLIVSSMAAPGDFEYVNFDWTHSPEIPAGQVATAYLRWTVELPDTELVVSFVSPGAQPIHVGLLFREHGWWNLKISDVTVLQAIELLPQERPDFRPIYVGGAPKSGTTWVEACLNALPDVLLTGENNFFSWPHQDDLQELAEKFESAWRGLSVTAMRRPFANVEAMIGYGRAELTLRQLATLTGLKLVGDKTPGNSERASTILALQPDALLIHCTRNPLDVAVSRFFHEAMLLISGVGDPIKGGYERIDHFNRVMEHGERPPKGLMFSDLNLFQQILRGWCDTQSHIHATGQRWSGRIHSISYEELIENPKSTLSRLLSFVGTPVSDERVESVLAATAFVKMSGGRARGQEDRQSFFRRGVIGDFANHLSAAQIAFAIAYVKENAPVESWKAYF
jgi:hypothetical protein